MIWVVLTNFMKNGYFGAYSDILLAREALTNFFNDNPNYFLDDIGHYQYIIHNLVTGEQYSAEIYYDEIDADIR